MADSSTSLHEAREELAAATLDKHRGIVSLMEELEAIDWYQQRIDATADEELAAILAHNRDEEKEHAAMMLEWLRRQDPKLDSILRTYLFSDERIVDIEEEEDHGSSSTARRARRSSSDASLGIGSLRQER